MNSKWFEAWLRYACVIGDGGRWILTNGGRVEQARSVYGGSAHTGASVKACTRVFIQPNFSFDGRSVRLVRRVP